VAVLSDSFAAVFAEFLLCPAQFVLFGLDAHRVARIERALQVVAFLVDVADIVAQLVAGNLGLGDSRGGKAKSDSGSDQQRLHERSPMLDKSRSNLRDLRSLGREI
jgi:hypothetical protein